MKLDPRINDTFLISDPFNAEAANKYIGRSGYFTDAIFNFSNLDNCCTGMLVCVEADNRHPYYCGIADEGAIVSGNFSFFLSAEFVEEKPKEKKFRPYTFMEFADKFPVGQPIKFRKKGNAEDELYLILLGYRSRQCNDKTIPNIYIGYSMPFTLDELFNDYEYRVGDEWKPFGVAKE